MNINIPVEDSKRPLDCPLCGGIPEIRVSKTAYSGNNRMDYFAVSCSNGHGPAEEGVSQEFMLKRWDAWAARITSILSSPIHPCPTCGRMPHVKANDLGLKLDCECRASSNPVSDPVAAIELWERNIEKRKRLKADVEFLNGIIARSSASDATVPVAPRSRQCDSEARTVPAGQSAAAKGNPNRLIPTGRPQILTGDTSHMTSETLLPPAEPRNRGETVMRDHDDRIRIGVVHLQYDGLARGDGWHGTFPVT